jgi:hypothetical protein
MTKRSTASSVTIPVSISAVLLSLAVAPGCASGTGVFAELNAGYGKGELAKFSVQDDIRDSPVSSAVSSLGFAVGVDFGVAAQSYIGLGYLQQRRTIEELDESDSIPAIELMLMSLIPSIATQIGPIPIAPRLAVAGWVNNDRHQARGAMGALGASVGGMTLLIGVTRESWKTDSRESWRSTGAMTRLRLTYVFD